MRALVQRVTEAWVTSAPTRGETHEEVGRIGRGLLVLLGVTDADDPAVARRMADKLWHLRVFEDDAGAMNRSAADVGGALLVVSQFTLYGDARKGRRPSFVAAARPEHAEPLVEAVADRLREAGATVASGRFRTHMQVGLVNDGPVTLLVELDT
ncbi:D-aminoacyl-tRNA deacylase [Egicoccus halophilus]|uniref:D-aminoacyl-tRNA deacylase n=1 Tax=Egicoccus halophilus TaxID=1670830 RepID=A0A8J3A6Z9_9ACTN|nr:D-aminoacyl-tRNA deacylase [Egicoccus halophilus]GGI03183.1 D-aminoacyl-tRNA deacylase [Egicoccus halophilus]